MAQRRILDKQRILSVFAAYLSNKYGDSEEYYIQNTKILDTKVQNDKNFPWSDIASEIGLDRWRLYHWYFETFQRMLCGAIEKSDVQIMRDMIREAFLKNEPLDKQFQSRLKDRLTKQYHRSSFSIAFNNTKRQVQKELEKGENEQTQQNTANVIQKENQQLITLSPTMVKPPQQNLSNQSLSISDIINSPAQPLTPKSVPSETALVRPEILEPCVIKYEKNYLEPLEEDQFMSTLTQEESEFLNYEEHFDHILPQTMNIYNPCNEFREPISGLEDTCLSFASNTCNTQLI